VDHSAAVGAVRRHLDRVGERQWSHLETDVAGRVSLLVHRRFLRRTVPAGAHVLEIGAASGRFTTELAALGCRVVVTDPSPARLAAHERRLRGTPAADRVLRREPLGLAGTDRFADGAFDAVLAYAPPAGAALPVPGPDAAFPRSAAPCSAAVDALRELLRLVGRDGVAVASVPSLLGGLRSPSRAAGGAPADRDGRYRWSDVVALAAAAGGRVVDGSASNWASLGAPGALALLEADPQRWERFLDAEVAACAEPGARDGGTHILFAVAADRRW
jgi:SAM-dependent methyltransferase